MGQVRCGAGPRRYRAVCCLGKVLSPFDPCVRSLRPRRHQRGDADRIPGAERGDSRLLWCAHSCELAIRKPAPEWAGKAVVNDAIVDLSSASLKGKWVVLFFYPLDFTFVCPTEIVEFNNKWVFTICPCDP